MTRWKHVVTSVDELREMVGEPRQAQLTKILDHVDQHCCAWIERSPFIALCSADANGMMDVSPKGDPPGFVKVIDPRTLAIPDRPGNRRADTFSNVLENPNVALIFVVPGRGETLRVAGKATLVRDPDLLATMVVNNREPKLALVLDIEQVMFHCGKSMIRSKLWQPEHWPSIDGLASYARLMAEQADADESLDSMEKRFGTWVHGNELY